MLSTVVSASVIGLDAVRIDVECDAGAGQYSCVIVGLPDTAVQESRERVRSAIKNSGLSFPRGRVTVNLAPADIKKQGAVYDLPIALSIILADSDMQGVFSDGARQEVAASVCVGELSLEGSVRPVAGVIAVAHFAREYGAQSVFVPFDNAEEAALIDGITVYPVKTFANLLDHLMGVRPIPPYQRRIQERGEEHAALSLYDLSHIKGQHHAKRALEIAAAGGHNLLLSGPPGSGKTMLARVLPTLLPPLTHAESLEVTRIWSVAGKLSPDQPLITVRPFRNPHHSASLAAIVGGGSSPHPGELTLAHRGVLFLDEFPEFSRAVIEGLRQPLEDGTVTVSRVHGSIRFPSRCQLVAAQNPCPCGKSGGDTNACVCSPHAISVYGKKISGPILDRMDITVHVPGVEYDDLFGAESEESSAHVRSRIIHARERQAERYRESGILTNSELVPQQIEQFCALSDDVRALLRSAVEKLSLSARSYGRVLKVARTIADLDGSDSITRDHIAESIQYRPQRV